MRRMITVVMMVSLLAMVPPFVSSVNGSDAEYEDLRTPEERGENDFLGYWDSPDYCKYFPGTYWACRKATKNNAIKDAKEWGRVFCKKLGAIGVEFSDIDTFVAL